MTSYSNQTLTDFNQILSPARNSYAPVSVQ